MRKLHRRGAMAMEKSAANSKCRTQFWYVALASFLLWIFLLYLFNSSAATVHNHERLFREDHADFTVLQEPGSDSVPVVSDNPPENNNYTWPESKNSGDNRLDQTLDDAKAVNDIVDELEKEKTENNVMKKKGDSVPTGRSGDQNTNLIARKGKEPPKARSREGSVSDNKKSVGGNDHDNGDHTKDNDEKLQKNRSETAPEVKARPRRERNVSVRPRPTHPNDPCAGKYVYVHDIPALFNEELLKNCWTLSRWTDMCELTSNLGLGPRLPNMEGVSGWFATNQFTLEVIFHNRMKQYRCLTKDSSLASAVFVPYYSGLDLMRFLWGPFPYMRDAAALDLMKWLRERPEWRRMDGRDHFMIAGRTTWDFMRTPENESDWGNRLMILPETKNMTMLLIESSPWNYHGFAIPYPTYFHPSSDSSILQWQNRMRRIKRRYLFSFVGAPRPNLGDSIRTEIMDQCRASRRKCKLLECVSGSQKCYKPDQIMKFFLSSTFCLQPPGDSYTRRSSFDSILAGCIPVFFHPGSAYVQYVWHLPRDITKYSVFIPADKVKGGKVSIERILSRIPREKVVAMKEEVIKLIPKVMYFDPSSNGVKGYEDAFEVAVKGVLERVEGLRQRVEEGAEEVFDFPEEYSWKYNAFGHVNKHEWDSYFDRP